MGRTRLRIWRIRNILVEPPFFPTEHHSPLHPNPLEIPKLPIHSINLLLIFHKLISRYLVHDRFRSLCEVFDGVVKRTDTELFLDGGNADVGERVDRSDDGVPEPVFEVPRVRVEVERKEGRGG